MERGEGGLRSVNPVPSLWEDVFNNKGQIKTTKVVVPEGIRRKIVGSRAINHLQQALLFSGGRMGSRESPPELRAVLKPGAPAEPMDSATSSPPLPGPPSWLHHPRRQEFGENAVSRSPLCPRTRLRQLQQHVGTANLGVCSPFGWLCGCTYMIIYFNQIGRRSLYTRFFQTFVRGSFVLG